MKSENAKVSIDKGKYEVDYVKMIPESLQDAFTLACKGDEKLTDEQKQAVKGVDAVFLPIPDKDKDGKDTTSLNPILDRLVGHFHYGFDLGVKARTRQNFERTLEDPSKLVIQGIKGLMANGFTLEMSYTLVETQRKANGVATPTLGEIQSKMK